MNFVLTNLLTEEDHVDRVHRVKADPFAREVISKGSNARALFQFFKTTTTPTTMSGMLDDLREAFEGKIVSWLLQHDKKKQRK
jgi:hypothetical protein